MWRVCESGEDTNATGIKKCSSLLLLFLFLILESDNAPTMSFFPPFQKKLKLWRNALRETLAA
jgi:hypothetical protein